MFFIKTKFELNQRLSLTVYEVSADNFETSPNQQTRDEKGHSCERKTQIFLLFSLQAESNMHDLVSEYQQYEAATVEEDEYGEEEGIEEEENA